MLKTKKYTFLFRAAVYCFLVLLFYSVAFKALGQAQGNTGTFKVGKLKYQGGGDWYANPSSLPNLFRFIRQNTRMKIDLNDEIVEPGSAQIFQYAMLYLTGHGNIEFSKSEAENLRKYLLGGGFLLADDNYGMNKYIVREFKKIFPDKPLVEVPYSHPIFKQHFIFTEGLPKIHEHDGKPAQGFGVFHDGRLIAMITYECDLGDGWEDREVHGDPEEVRQKALRMGANIIMYVINN